MDRACRKAAKSALRWISFSKQGMGDPTAGCPSQASHWEPSALRGARSSCLHHFPGVAKLALSGVGFPLLLTLRLLHVQCRSQATPLSSQCSGVGPHGAGVTVVCGLRGWSFLLLVAHWPCGILFPGLSFLLCKMGRAARAVPAPPSGD